MRLLWLFLFLAILVIGPFMIWGGFFDELFDYEATKAWLGRFGPSWAWLAGIGLLMSDLFLPIPGTVVMSALGYVYGFWLGGLVAASGSMLAGMLAYGLCRLVGRGAAEWIAGREDLAKGERLFGGAAGGWIVALSRWLPVMPEVIACLAGLARMPWPRFMMAMACGCVPLGYTFAAIGVWGHDNPVLAIVLSAGLPPLLWAIVGPMVMRRRAGAPESDAVSGSGADGKE